MTDYPEIAARFARDTANHQMTVLPLTQLQSDLHRLLARQRVDAAAQRLQWLLAHPEAVATAPHASDGEAAEYRHWLYDADADATTPAFPYPSTIAITDPGHTGTR